MTAPKAKHRVPDVVKIVREYFEKPGNSVGGSLHAVFEDSNLDDGSMQWCLNWALEKGDEDGANLARILLECSQSQRRRIVRSAP